MKHLISCLIIGIGTAGFAQTSSFEMIRKLSGFSHPESVLFDKDQEVFFVSNMAGKKDRDGFISKVSLAGDLLDTLYTTGLNDPKGMLIWNDKLLVTDVTFLVEIDRTSGKILRRIQLEHAKSLNDIAADKEGNIYISDLAGNSIFKMDLTGHISQWLHDPQLERPNGLLISGKQLFIASWGSKEEGNLLKVNLKTKEITQVSKCGVGNLDGIQEIAPQSFLVSDWATGKIYRMNTNGSSIEMIQSAKSAGDILLLRDTPQLLIPMNHQNEIWWYATK
jgi:sugar lactone lactonase YvrE